MLSYLIRRIPKPPPKAGIIISIIMFIPEGLRNAILSISLFIIHKADFLSILPLGKRKRRQPWRAPLLCTTITSQVFRACHAPSMWRGVSAAMLPRPTDRCNSVDVALPARAPYGKIAHTTGVIPRASSLPRDFLRPVAIASIPYHPPLLYAVVKERLRSFPCGHHKPFRSRLPVISCSIKHPTFPLSGRSDGFCKSVFFLLDTPHCRLPLMKEVKKKTKQKIASTSDGCCDILFGCGVTNHILSKII